MSCTYMKGVPFLIKCIRKCKRLNLRRSPERNIPPNEQSVPLLLSGPTEAIKDSENFPATLVAVVCVSALVAIAIIIGLLVMVRLSKSARGPAVKDVTADLARDNLAFEDLEIKTLSIKSNEKPI